jgi:AcrR family transcriptional regulator
MKKSSDSQRKAPRQSRSKALVDSIFEATVRILPQIGSKKITTKKIAEVAGVSIGSLYQYFPNKESLLGALMDLGMNRMTTEMHKRIDSFDGQSMEALIDTSVDYVLEMFLTEKEKNREIFRQVPELGRIANLYGFRQKVVERLALELERHNPGHKKPEYVLCSFVAVNSVMGIVQTMLYDEKQSYTIEQLSSELKIMLKGYFQHRVKA